MIWPQQPGIPIYHNRAIWPFVSAYALRAARRVDAPARIAHELRSLLRGAALSGSNMENFELTTQAVHFDDTAPDGRSLSGPVVNSRRQLWSVAGYAAMVLEGVYGLEADGRVAPKLPAELVPLLFGERREIALQLRDRRITLRRPSDEALASIGPDALLVAGQTIRAGRDVRVDLKPVAMAAAPLRLNYIHPFVGRNGRVSRLMSHAMAHHAGIGARADDRRGKKRRGGCLESGGDRGENGCGADARSSGWGSDCIVEIGHRAAGGNAGNCGRCAAERAARGGTVGESEW